MGNRCNIVVFSAKFFRNSYLQNTFFICIFLLLLFVTLLFINYDSIGKKGEFTMKRTITFLLTLILLFGLVGCNTNTATPESTLEAGQTPYYTPLQEPTFSCNPEPTADPTSTPEETWEGIPTPSPSILETPSGHYANGFA